MMASDERASMTVKQVLRVVGKLEGQLSSGRKSDAMRALAVLRRGAGMPPGGSPEAWAVAFDECSEEILGQGERPSDEERTVYLMITLYACHRQGRQAPAHSGDGLSLGKAMRRVAEERDRDKPTMPRSFASLMSASSYDEVEYHLRQSIARIKGLSCPLDYGRLTRQVLAFQNPYRRDGIRLQWSREYSMSGKSRDDGAGDGGGDETAMKTS